MSTVEELRQIAASARPAIEQSLDVADELKEIAAAAREKGIDWTQLKALIKAEILDEKDGGERVQEIIERAEYACAYADMLGYAKHEQVSETRSSSPKDTIVAVTTADGSTGEMPRGTFVKLAEAAKTPTGRTVVAAALVAVKDNADGLDIPPCLQRSPAS